MIFIILFKLVELKRDRQTHHVYLTFHRFMKTALRVLFLISFRCDIFSRSTCIITSSSDQFLPLNMNVLENMAYATGYISSFVDIVAPYMLDKIMLLTQVTNAGRLSMLFIASIICYYSSYNLQLILQSFFLI